MISQRYLKTTLVGAMAITAALLSRLEGTRYEVYYDIAGVATVCEGITGYDVIPGKKYTRRECDLLLEKHISLAKKEVDRDVKVYIPDSMRAAMYSFTFNAGRGAFRYSRMLTLINEGRLMEACQQLNRWVYFTNPKTKKKEVSTGLKNRRNEEYATCIKDL